MTRLAASDSSCLGVKGSNVGRDARHRYPGRLGGDVLKLANCQDLFDAVEMALADYGDIKGFDVWDNHYDAGCAALGEAWYWVDEDPTHWSLTARLGFMRIITQVETRNWLARRAPDADFEIRTHLYFTLTENFQFAGLTVFLDTENHLSFGGTFCDTPAPACVGNGIYYDHIEDGERIGSNFATTTSVPNEVYLRIIRQESSYTGYFSTNGTEWIEVGTHGIGFEPAGVGLYARNQEAVSEIPADFDYFVLAHQYLKIFLPVAVNNK